jgi:hypothetical protein
MRRQQLKRARLVSAWGAKTLHPSQLQREPQRRQAPNPALSSGRRSSGSPRLRAHNRAVRGRTRSAHHPLAPGQPEARCRQRLSAPRPSRTASGPAGAWPAARRRRWPSSSEARASKRETRPGNRDRRLAAQPQTGSHQARPDCGAQRAPTAGAAGAAGASTHSTSTGLPRQPPGRGLGPELPAVKPRQVLTRVHAHVTLLRPVA